MELKLTNILLKFTETHLENYCFCMCNPNTPWNQQKVLK